MSKITQEEIDKIDWSDVNDKNVVKTVSQAAIEEWEEYNNDN